MGIVYVGYTIAVCVERRCSVARYLAWSDASHSMDSHHFCWILSLGHRCGDTACFRRRSRIHYPWRALFRFLPLHDCQQEFPLLRSIRMMDLKRESGVTVCVDTGCGFLLWEMSTPFVHLRWFLYKIGMKESKLYLYNGLLMIVAFGLCRICWGGCTCPPTYPPSLVLMDTLVDLGIRFLLAASHPQDTISSGTIWCLRFIWITLNFLNWYWFKLMLSAALRAFKKPSRESNPKLSGTSNTTLESKKAK